MTSRGADRALSGAHYHDIDPETVPIFKPTWQNSKWRSMNRMNQENRVGVQPLTQTSLGELSVTAESIINQVADGFDPYRVLEARGDLFHGTHSGNLASIMTHGITPTGSGEHSSGHVYATRDYAIAHAEASKAASRQGHGTYPVVFKIDRNHPSTKGIKWSTDTEYWNKDHGDTLKDKSAFKTSSPIHRDSVKLYQPPRTGSRKPYNPSWLDD